MLRTLYHNITRKPNDLSPSHWCHTKDFFQTDAYFLDQPGTYFLQKH